MTRAAGTGRRYRPPPAKHFFSSFWLYSTLSPEPAVQGALTMQGVRSVISTLTSDGQEVMGPGVLVWHYPDNSIVNNSLLTVESNHFCVLKSRGAILNVYDT